MLYPETFEEKSHWDSRMPLNQLQQELLNTEEIGLQNINFREED